MAKTITRKTWNRHWHDGLPAEKKPAITIDQGSVPIVIQQMTTVVMMMELKMSRASIRQPLIKTQGMSRMNHMVLPVSA